MKYRLSALVAALGLSMAASVAQADVIKIAAVGPVTGPVTQYGDIVREGIMTEIGRAHV